MNQYRRIVSYLYKYENGEKGENTGFVRIDTRKEGIRLLFRLKDLRMMDEKRLKIYFYFHRENKLQLIFVDEFLCVRGNCEYKTVVFPEFTDGDLEKMNGVMILDSKGLLYASCWDEKKIHDDMILDEFRNSTEANVPIEESLPKEKTIRDTKMTGETLLKRDTEMIGEKSFEEEIESSEEEMELSETEMDNLEMKSEEAQCSLLSKFPVIDMYNPEGALYPVRIQMGDIPMLPSTEWKLVDNAFLKQAYERENHLLLGKIQMPGEETIWVLGVPGIYDNREKYLAGIFGFTDYIPVEEMEYKTGGRGYWIRQIGAVEA